LKQSKAANVEDCAAHTKIQVVEIIGNMMQIGPEMGRTPNLQELSVNTPTLAHLTLMVSSCEAVFNLLSFGRKWKMIAWLCHCCA
jgi:hypothetical protein